MVEHHESTVSDVCVVGLGYVGITLAAALLKTGRTVLGYESNVDVANELARGVLRLSEPGVEQIIADTAGDRLQVTSDLTGRSLPPIVIICVGTPVDDETKQPDLRQIVAAVRAVAAGLTDDTLLIVRSTVPIGTTRNLVGGVLAEYGVAPALAFCPERTIQGKALEELLSLPQIVGGLDDRAVDSAADLFRTVTTEVVPVSSLEAAEAIKLLCNCHTDLIYGFGNQVALVAETLGLNADELVRSANLDYPRPDLHRAGLVGGSCLTKDPYLLAYSMEPHGAKPSMVLAARQLNESMPIRGGERVLAALREAGCELSQAKILVSGVAYKGQPETDDLRGAPIYPLLDLFKGLVGTVVAHDYAVPPERIRSLGLEPVSLADGFAGAHAVLLLNNHRSYGDEDFDAMIATMSEPAIVYDAWRITPDTVDATNATVLRMGRG